MGEALTCKIPGKRGSRCGIIVRKSRKGEEIVKPSREGKTIRAMATWMERVFFLLLLLVPLTISPISTDMYTVPKTFLVQALILLLVTLSLIKGTLTGGFWLPWTPLTGPALALLGTALLSLTKALNPFQGIEQAFSLFLLLLLLHLAALHLTTHEELFRLFGAVALATILVAAYGLLQAKGIDFLNLQWRFVPVSTLGNTGFAAEYLIASLPLLLTAASTGQKGLLFGGAAILAVIHLLLTKSRGGWMALTAALIVMAIFRRQKAKACPELSRRGKKQKAKDCVDQNAPDPSAIRHFRSKILKGVVVAAVVTGIATSLTLLFPDVWWTTGERILSIFDPSYPSNRVRILIWGSTLKMIEEAPLLGVGIGNYELVYPLYRTVEEWRLSSRFVVGEAHNDYLQMAAETGLLGLACFLWLLARLFQRASRLLKTGDEGWRRPGLALTGSLVALLIYAFFAFPLRNPTSSLHFWLFAGLLVAGEAAASNRPLKPVRIPLGISWALTLVLLALASVLVFGRFFADLHLKRMKALLAAGREQEARQEYDRAVFLYFPVFFTHQVKAKAFDDRRMLPLAAEQLRKELQEHPRQARPHAELGTIYGEMGLYQEAVEELRAALALDPTLLGAWENLGYAYFLLGKYQSAIEAYREALRRGRESPTLRQKLALALLLAGRRQEAEEEWRKAGQGSSFERRPLLGFP